MSVSVSVCPVGGTEHRTSPTRALILMGLFKLKFWTGRLKRTLPTSKNLECADGGARLSKGAQFSQEFGSGCAGAPYEGLRTVCHGRYGVLHTIGEGISGKVKLGVDLQTGEEVALKFMADPASESNPRSREHRIRRLKAEVEALQTCGPHPCVLQMREVDYDAALLKANGTVSRKVLIVLEFASNGELLDLIYNMGPISKTIARFYSSQLLHAIAYCHSVGVYHRDLKPENLLLNSDFTLKLADFGLCSLLHGEEGGEQDKSPSLPLMRTARSVVGSEGYMAPEILAGHRYDPAKADVWSAGVIIFILVTGHPPFEIAAHRDWWFRAVAEGDYSIFWQSHCKDGAKIPKEAKQLLERMLVADPEERAQVSDLLSFPWISDSNRMPSPDEVAKEMSTRRAQAMKQKEKQFLGKGKAALDDLKSLSLEPPSEAPLSVVETKEDAVHTAAAAIRARPSLYYDPFEASGAPPVFDAPVLGINMKLMRELIGGKPNGFVSSLPSPMIIDAIVKALREMGCKKIDAKPLKPKCKAVVKGVAIVCRVYAVHSTALRWVDITHANGGGSKHPSFVSVSRELRRRVCQQDDDFIALENSKSNVDLQQLNVDLESVY